MQPSKAQDPVAAWHPDIFLMPQLSHLLMMILMMELATLDEHEKFAINTRAVKCLYA